MRSGKPLLVRVPDKLRVMVDEMAQELGTSITDYICGLVILDIFHRTNLENRAQRLAGVTIPGWTSRLILSKPPRPKKGNEKK